MNQKRGGELGFELEGPLGVAGEGEEDLFELAPVGGDGEVGCFGSEGEEGLSGGEAAEDGCEVEGGADGLGGSGEGLQLAGHSFDPFGGADDFAHVFAERAAGGEGVENLFAIAGEDHEEVIGFVEDAAGEAGGSGGGGLVGGAFFEGGVGRRGRWGGSGPLDEDEVGRLIIPALEAKKLPIVMEAGGERQTRKEPGDPKGGEFAGSDLEVLQERAVTGDKLPIGFDQGDWSGEQSHDILVVSTL